jgi:hypothetical protein
MNYRSFNHTCREEDKGMKKTMFMLCLGLFIGLSKGNAEETMTAEDQFAAARLANAIGVVCEKEGDETHLTLTAHDRGETVNVVLVPDAQIEVFRVRKAGVSISINRWVYELSQAKEGGEIDLVRSAVKSIQAHCGEKIDPRDLKLASFPQVLDPRMKYPG